MTMKIVLIQIAVLLLVRDSWQMSEAQVKAAVKMVRNVCQPKTKATSEDIDKMHEGDWNIEEEAKCYMACAMNMYKLFGSDNKLNYESGLKQLKQLPESLREPTQVCMDQCKDAAVSPEKCQAAYELSKCFYECNPEKYFLP